MHCGAIAIAPKWDIKLWDAIRGSERNASKPKIVLPTGERTK